MPDSKPGKARLPPRWFIRLAWALIAACISGPVAGSVCGDPSPAVGAPCALPPPDGGQAWPAP